MRLVNPKRVCIYFFFDKEGIVDDYIVYQLKELKKNISFIHFVVNGKLDKNGAEKVHKYVDEIYIRKNEGNDIGAYKAAIKHLGWEFIRQFDELVLTNHTCFGPVYPFEEVFSWAKNTDCDIWGLTWGHKLDWGVGENYLHKNNKEKHIQSYFYAIRKPLLGSKLLADFYDCIPNDCTYAQSVAFYEYAIPGYFEKKGYIGCVYCDDSDFNYPLLHNPAYLLEKYRMPLFKRRSFYQQYTDILSNTMGESTRKLVEFVDKKTDYDMNMVWDSVLRTCSLSDVVRCAQLNRVLPRDYLFNPSEEEELKTGLIMYLHNSSHFDEYISVIENFSDDIEMLVMTTSKKKKEWLEDKLEQYGKRITIVAVDYVGREVKALLVDASTFVFRHDLICFLHDVGNIKNKPESVTRAYKNKILESLCPTKEYVNNVISLFKSEKRLGLAMPSYANHNEYGYTAGSGWGGCFEAADLLMSTMQVKAKRNSRTLCVAPESNCFWFRSKAIKKLFDGKYGKGWNLTEFEFEPHRSNRELVNGIKKIYAYVAQEAGYYPVFLYNDKLTEIELTNLELLKAGSEQMRIDIDRMTDEVLKGTSEHLDDRTIHETINNKPGIRDSINLLSQAVKDKHYIVWKVLAPVRFIGHKIFVHRFDK